MLTYALLLFGAAALCWPVGVPAERLRALSDDSSSCGWRLPAGRSAAVAAVVAGGLASYWLLGPAGGAVGALFALTAVRRVQARRRTAARVAATREVAEALGGLVAELRAGAHPAVAADSVAADMRAGSGHSSWAAAGLRAIASAARLGGDVDVALGDSAATDSTALHRVARAWALAQRHGLPLADVLDAVRRDLDAGVRFAGQLHARLAGPRASAAVLAGLPAVGLLLGEGMGARPVDVLASTAAGQALLVLGGLFLVAGIGWSGRLTRQVVPL